MNCKNHSDKMAAYQCEGCLGYFCDNCASVRRMSDNFTAYVCKECGGKCKSLTDVKGARQKKGGRFVFSGQPKAEKKQPPVLPQAKAGEAKNGTTNFWLSLPGLLIFPLKGKGIFVVLAMAGLLFVLEEFSSVFFPYNLVPWVLFLAYFMVYLLKTMEDTLHDALRLKKLPDLNYWLEASLLIFYTGLAFVVCFGPAHIYFFLSHRFGMIYFGLLGAGLFFLPMLLIRIVILRTLVALNPFSGFTAVTKHISAYLAMLVLLAGFIFLFLYVSADILGAFDKRFYFVSYVLAVYLAFMAMRLLGIYGRCYWETFMKPSADGKAGAL